MKKTSKLIFILLISWVSLCFTTSACADLDQIQRVELAKIIFEAMQQIVDETQIKKGADELTKKLQDFKENPNVDGACDAYINADRNCLDLENTILLFLILTKSDGLKLWELIVSLANQNGDLLREFMGVLFHMEPPLDEVEEDRFIDDNEQETVTVYQSLDQDKEELEQIVKQLEALREKLSVEHGKGDNILINKGKLELNSIEKSVERIKKEMEELKLAEQNLLRQLQGSEGESNGTIGLYVVWRGDFYGNHPSD